jgi:rhamnulokinase
VLRLVGGAELLYDRTGIQFLQFNTLPQIAADLCDEPTLVSRTGTRLLIADYLLYRLSGAMLAERTIASTTQLLDARSGTWAADVISAVGDDAARWPRLVAPGTLLGPVRRDALHPFDGEPPLAIATCSHDTAAAVAAVPAGGDRPWAYISSGTWSLVGAELRAPLLVSEAREAGFTNESGLDGTVRFLKNRTGMWVLEECVREWAAADGERVSYDMLMTVAAAAPPTDGTIDLNAPEFAQRGGMDRKIATACRAVGMSPPNGRGAVVRLVLESLAESYRCTLAELDALTGTPAEVVHVVGGGARNALLNQLTADASGRPVIAGPQEATALGNLLVQARTLGDLPAGVSVREAARQSSRLTTYEPSNARV